MHSSPQSALSFETRRESARKEPRHRDHVTYQVITFAAMLLVLVTVWVF